MGKIFSPLLLLCIYKRGKKNIAYFVKIILGFTENTNIFSVIFLFYLKYEFLRKMEKLVHFNKLKKRRSIQIKKKEAETKFSTKKETQTTKQNNERKQKKASR